MDFLAAICAAPDDDGPRLVYADHLLESKNELERARGELIVAQCGPTTRESRRRAAELLELVRAHEETPVPVQEWSRGFPSEIQISRESLREHQAAIARMPLETIALTGDAPVTIADLAWVRAAFPCLRTLSIVHGDGGVSLDTRRLPALDAGTELAWPPNATPDRRLLDAITRLTLSPHDHRRLEPYVYLPLPALDALVLRGSDRERMIAVAAQQRQIRRLVWFVDYGTSISGPELVRTGVLAKLTSLHATVDLDHALADAIAASSIDDLLLQYGGKAGTLARIFTPAFTKRVRRLDLRYASSDHEPIRSLGVGRFEALESLKLEHFHLTKDAARLDMPFLTQLLLEECLQDKAAPAEIAGFRLR